MYNKTSLHFNLTEGTAVVQNVVVSISCVVIYWKFW